MSLQDDLAAVKAAEAGILPTASAGQVAQDDGTTGIQNPNQPVSVLTTDGRINPANTETGTADPVRTLQQTQSTPVFTQDQINQDRALTDSRTTELARESAGIAPANAPTSPGVGANSADAASPTKNATAQEVDNVFNSAGPLVPQPNILDQYASYTYTASFYLMKPEAFTAMVKSKKFSPAGNQLLFQSGGAAVTGRNPYFSNDYYIDKMELTSSITGKGTNSAHNVQSIKMTVVEPNGITLIENLDKAVQEYLGTAGNPPKKKNFQAQLYLLVIKFWGYDDSGKLVPAGQTPSGATSTSPQAAIVTKYYPMTLSSIKFKISNKLVEYEIEGTGVQYQINTGQLRAVVPYNIELSSGSLQDAFNGASDVVTTSETTTTRTGNATVETTTETTTKPRDETNTTDSGTTTPPTAPPKADAAPTTKLTVRQGIVAAMNQFQRDLVKSEQITYPDVYSVEFVTDAIAQAKIKKTGQDAKASPPPSGGSAKEKLDSNTQSLDKTTRLLSITAGQPMVQVIDQLLKNSTYIEDQQLWKIIEKTGAQVPNGAAASNLAWYKISMQATPGQYDPKRNAPAYNIKYIIHPYKINDMISNYFTTPKYNGVHKQYNYWFTGLNTAILNYEQTYNTLYTQVLSGGPTNKNAIDQSTVQMTPATASSQSSQGAKGKANEPAANAADYLYSPGDNNECTMTIIGDPAWLQQGETTFGVDSKNFNFKGFLPDGTINFDSQQILFEVLFNTPSDYNLNTGLMDPNSPESTQNKSTTATSQPGANRKSFIFIANECISEFVKGKFTQTLKGSRINYFGDQAQKAGAVARPGANVAALGNTVTTGTASSSRTPNNAIGPNGQNSIPTEQPSAGGPNTTGTNSAIAPTSEDQADANSANSPAPVIPRPATPPSPPTSDGDIQALREYAASRPSTGGVQSQTQQDQLAEVSAAYNAQLQGSNLAPAPAILPTKSPTETYDQYQAKLENAPAQQVNTTPPQTMNKSDQ